MSKEKLIYLPVGVLTLATALSGAVLGSAGSYADGNTATASVTVGDACTFTEGSGWTGTLELSNGEATTEGVTDKPSMTATCNDPQGFSIYAIGASDEVTVGSERHTNYMKGSTNDTYIPAGTSGDSYWAMKVRRNDGAAGSIQNDFAVYTAVPNTNTEIIRVPGVTTGSATTTVRTDYKVHVGATQAAGTYTGKVKYTLVHQSAEQATD